MRALTMIAWACRLRRPGIIFTPSVRSLAIVLVVILVVASTRGTVTVTGVPAQALVVGGAGASLAALNASMLLRDVNATRDVALRYYGLTGVDSLILYAVATLPLTALEAACGMLVLDLPGWSESGRFGLLLAAWTAATALAAIGGDWLRRADNAARWALPRVKVGLGAYLGRSARAGRLSALLLVYLRSSPWWQAVLVIAEAALVAYVLGRLGQPVEMGVHVTGVYLAATVICILAEVDDTPAARFARTRYAITDAELRGAKLALAGPVLIIGCTTAGLINLWAGARAGSLGLLACLVYLPLLTLVLADAATAYTRRHRMLPAAELGALLLALIPGLPLAVFPAIAHLLRRSTRA